MNSQSKYICVTNTQIKCQNSTSTREAPHTPLATITITGNHYPALQHYKHVLPISKLY